MIDLELQYFCFSFVVGMLLGIIVGMIISLIKIRRKKNEVEE